MRGDVAPLRIRRDKILAHLDPRAVADFDAVASESAVTFDAMEELYMQAGEMVNAILVAYRGSETAMEVLGWDDFEKVLELMERGSKAQLDDLKKEHHLSPAKDRSEQD